MNSKFKVSNDFIAWAQSLSGMLTTMRKEYGSMEEMVERADWDEGKTRFACSLIQNLHANLGEIEKELSRHVTDKYG